MVDRLHLGEIHRQWRAGCYDTLGYSRYTHNTHTHSKAQTNFEDRINFWQYREHLWYH